MGRFWTDKERKVLAKFFPDNYTSYVCEKLNRSYASVSAQASLMGLKKSQAFVEYELNVQANRLKVDGKKYQYQKCSVPPNKGKKMPPEVYERCKGTMFKKGAAPHNTKYDGHERLSKDGYIEMRIRPGKYVLKHRYVWEQHNGPIPPNMIVVFKDGNSQNITIENLQLISRHENMKRNTIQRFPLELRQTIRIVSKLKRVINEKQN
jgi:hypothetical protein